MNEGKLILPHDYENKLDYVSTEIAIKYVKDLFERRLAYHLNLMRVSAPLFVRKDSGLNDNLNGVERPVTSISGISKAMWRSCTRWPNGSAWR